mmetsp:Transcript_97465/g.278706  ORF Transcript_97465/g.278706 Transcript_97465/m.278706 type:complete len:562 (-) Transcript_97465:545-2230(-)|eukprot:CAMPEP_0119467384 /NCGR_PEP_ID=MMETSP1344-20130328/1593_1 /TAXON_ID=236787 /ORGANISM="Florenciella parvula, Strain CCMP2471" /LENGTH=561 /DNA_ID=CAMNT_0007499745 /DNA_START=174 /DNA_END=1859 /DNA_ORIENTATION=+
MRVLRVVVAALLSASVSVALIAEHEVTSLPGWDGELPSKLFSGFIDASEGHHVHYTYVESENDPAADPVVLWVQGGPGGSSMEGMWIENMFGLALNGNSMATSPPTLFRSPASWSSVANMLFWEAPAGVGFSYCDDGDGCPGTHWNDTTSAADNAKFLCAFFEAYPELQSRDFFMTGESYAGVYIPTTALYLLEHQCGAFDINLKGVAIGNGCVGTEAGTCSPQRAVNTFNLLSKQGFMSTAQVNEVELHCADSAGFTRASPSCQAAAIAASNAAGPFFNYMVHDTCDPSDMSSLLHFICSETVPTAEWACDAAGLRPPPESYHHFEGPFGASLYGYDALESTTPKEQRHHPLKEKAAAYHHNGGHHRETEAGQRTVDGVMRRLDQDGSVRGATDPESYQCGSSDAMAAYLSDPSVMEALHVTDANMESWPGNSITYSRTAENLLVSPGYPDLVDQVRVLIYSGDFDGQIPYLGTEGWTTGMGYAEKDGGAWRAWTLNDGDVSNETIGGTPSGAVAGHVTSYDVPTEFTFLTVAQAGHMVPAYRATEALAMLKRFLAQEDY